ncbi:unnamed protein product [Lathyrus oleraceus]
MPGIREDLWFKEGYKQADPNDDEDEDVYVGNRAFSINELTHEEEKRRSETPIRINAFELIGMSSSLDLSRLFENEDVSERKIRFTTNLSAKDLMKKIEDSVADMEFRVQKKNGKIKVIQENKEHKTPGSLSVAIEDYEDILIPTDEQWPFLLRFPIGCFGICLGLSSQAVLWHNLATSPATRH